MRDVIGPCAEWQGARTNGYGRFTIRFGRGRGGHQQTFQAHRMAYELLVGPIPGGLVIDHLCRNPACVNPDHMEPVTIAENVRRGSAGQHGSHRRLTHCKYGHAFTEANTLIDCRGRRRCKTCRQAWDRARRRR